MCMSMGGTAQQMPTAVTPAPPAVNTLAFDKTFNAQMASKKDPTITRDNPLLAKSQRAKLDARNAPAEQPQTGIQYA